MKKALGILVVATLALSACNSVIKGQINIQQPLPVKVTVKSAFPGDGGDQTEIRDFVVKPGTYNASLGYKFRNVLNLQISRSGQPGEILIDVPRGAAIPKDGGTIHWAAVDTHQPWNADGEVLVDKSTTPERAGWESCPLTRDYWYCEPGYGNNPPRCYYRQETYWGRREIRFYENITTRTILLDLTDPTSHALLSQLNGSQTEKEQVTTYWGHCYY